MVLPCLYVQIPVNKVVTWSLTFDTRHDFTDQMSLSKERLEKGDLSISTLYSEYQGQQSHLWVGANRVRSGLPLRQPHYLGLGEGEKSTRMGTGEGKTLNELFTKTRLDSSGLHLSTSETPFGREDERQGNPEDGGQTTYTGQARHLTFLDTESKSEGHPFFGVVRKRV